MGVEKFLVATLIVPERCGRIRRTFYNELGECDIRRARAVLGAMSYNAWQRVIRRYASPRVSTRWPMLHLAACPYARCFCLLMAVSHALLDLMAMGKNRYWKRSGRYDLHRRIFERILKKELYEMKKGIIEGLS